MEIVDLEAFRIQADLEFSPQNPTCRATTLHLLPFFHFFPIPICDDRTGLPSLIFNKKHLQAINHLPKIVLGTVCLPNRYERDLRSQLLTNLESVLSICGTVILTQETRK